MSKPSWVGEVVSARKDLLMEEGLDLLLQVTHMGQDGPKPQPTDPTEIEQVTVVCIDLIHQYPELAMVKAAKEDGVDNLHHTDKISARLADLAHSAPCWRMQCTSWMVWVYLAVSQWFSSSEAAPSLLSPLGHHLLSCS